MNWAVDVFLDLNVAMNPICTIFGAASAVDREEARTPALRFGLRFCEKILAVESKVQPNATTSAMALLALCVRSDRTNNQF